MHREDLTPGITVVNKYFKVGTIISVTTEGIIVHWTASGQIVSYLSIDDMEEKGIFVATI